MLTHAEFEIVAKTIYDESGIVFKENKKYFVENRIQTHMEELNIKSIEQYIMLIRKKGDVLDDFVSKITTNETYFYREFYHLQLFSKLLIKDNFKSPIRILSIPTSSGEEPYSISIVANETLELKKSYSIIGVDIDKNILDKAIAGRYDDRSVSKLPQQYLNKYFDVKHGMYEIKNIIKSSVRFHRGSITDRNFVKSLGKFNYIFCKNLLIYFDDESKNRAINNMYDILEENGWLFLGHAETLSKTSSLFEPVKFEDTIIYKKAEEE